METNVRGTLDITHRPKGLYPLSMPCNNLTAGNDTDDYFNNIERHWQTLVWSPDRTDGHSGTWRLRGWPAGPRVHAVASLEHAYLDLGLRQIII